MLSPRRTKPDPVIVMYELRTVRALKPLPTMRVIESRIKKWRGLLRWTMQAFASPRGEAVVQIVGERQSQVSRRDNLFSSWQRLVKLVGARRLRPRRVGDGSEWVLLFRRRTRPARGLRDGRRESD